MASIKQSEEKCPKCPFELYIITERMWFSPNKRQFKVCLWHDCENAPSDQKIVYCEE